ncbi:MAG: serine hydrolase [Acidobacteriota bacterium]
MPTTRPRRSSLAAVLTIATTLAVTLGSGSALGQTRRTGQLAGMDLDRLARIDAVVAEAVAAHDLPGAVVLIGRGDTIVWQKAYGQRAVTPTREAMTTDTIFDLASLTKVIATAPAIMQLVEEGRLRLSDPVVTYLPEFTGGGRERVTIRDLLTHMSGLPPDLDLRTAWTGRETAIRMAASEPLQGPPGQRFVYSDINFVLVAEIVARVRRQPFETVVRDRVLAPLGMHDTTFLPPASWRPRTAPTDATTPRGTVHDPTARRMGGVAGHAGVFGTAADLARFCRMMLGGGALGTARVLAPLSVARMTSPATPATEPNVRGLGWDLDSVYSANRGDLLPLGSYGHTGFTGTSVWIDPVSRVFVIFLSNRLHPDGAGNVTPLRAKIATIAAAAITDPPAREVLASVWPRPTSAASGAAVAAAPSARASVSTGVDVLRAQQFAPLKDLRVGLLTNHTGRARDGAATIDLLATAPGVKLIALFSPEHGIRGILDAAVPSTVDERTQLPIYSLYGATERPTPAMLDGLDAIVIDLQDVGTRFYTYMTTMAYVMEAAAPRRIKVFVLDRPNPIGGTQVEGPALDTSARSFNGYITSMPIRHGLTLGELATLFNGELRLGADLTVVKMQGWRREAWFDETGLTWVNPSPNLRRLYEAELYPGLGAFERTNISVGRGTDAPFEHIGAPWIDGGRLAADLNARAIPGVRFYPESFTPASSIFANELCQGVFIVITDRRALRPVRVGVEMASALRRLFPDQFDIDKAASLFGSLDGLARIKSGEDGAVIAASWADAEARWTALSAKYLLY